MRRHTRPLSFCVMLALAACLPKKEDAPADESASAQRNGAAATGDPPRASAFKGECLLAARFGDMVAALVARWPDLRLPDRERPARS